MIELGNNTAEVVPEAPKESVPYINVAEVRETISEQYPKVAAAAVVEQAAKDVAGSAVGKGSSEVTSLIERRNRAVTHGSEVVARRLGHVA